MGWLRIREMVRKEFIQLFRDRTVRSIIVLTPLLQLLIFGYVVNYDIKNIRVSLNDEAQTRESRLLLNSLTAGKIFALSSIPAGVNDMEKLFLEGKTDIGIRIPPDFSERIRSGKTANIQVLADGSMSNIAAVRISYLNAVIDRFNARMIHEHYRRDLSYGRIDARIRTWYNPNTDSQKFFVPGMVAFIVMLISMLLTSIAIIREKEVGTMEQLIVTPIKPLELVIGKTIPYTAIALGQTIVILPLAIFWFDIPLAGSILDLFLAVCLFLLSTLGIGLFISTVSKTQQQAMMTTFFFLMPFFMLSGFVFPISNMPIIVQWLTYLNPLRYILTIIRGIFLKGVGIGVLWEQYVALAVLGLIVFIGAIKRFHKRLE
jgi:ABC-2 type transport system permease protein